MMKLSKSQCEIFHEQGYLHVPDALPMESLDKVVCDLDRVVDEVAQRLYAEGSIRDLHADKSFENKIAFLSRDSGMSLQQFVSFPRNRSQALFDFMHDPLLLELVESLVGPEIYGHPCQYIRAKLPQSIIGSDYEDFANKSPVHQDAGVLLPEADNTLVITTWIPLVDATVESGTLRVYPNYHRGEILTHVHSPGYGLTIHPDCMPKTEPEVINVHKGGLLILAGRTPHGSEVNRSDIVRWSMDLRWNDANMPSGRPMPGFIAKSAMRELTRYNEWDDAWKECLADKTPRKVWRWDNPSEVSKPSRPTPVAGAKGL